MMWMFVDVECKDWSRATFVEVKCNNGKSNFPWKEAAARIAPSSQNAGMMLSEAVATLMANVEKVRGWMTGEKLLIK
jgi:hypothetical protein